MVIELVFNFECENVKISKYNVIKSKSKAHKKKSKVDKNTGWTYSVYQSDCGWTTDGTFKSH